MNVAYCVKSSVYRMGVFTFKRVVFLNTRKHDSGKADRERQWNFWYLVSAVPGSDAMHKVSIIPRGIDSLGYTSRCFDRRLCPDDAARAGEQYGDIAGQTRCRTARRPYFRARHHRRRRGSGESDRNRPQHGHALRHEPEVGPAFLRRQPAWFFNYSGSRIPTRNQRLFRHHRARDRLRCALNRRCRLSTCKTYNTLRLITNCQSRSNSGRVSLLTSRPSP